MHLPLIRAAPPPASQPLYLFSHNDAPFRHNYRHYSARGEREQRVLTRNEPRAQCSGCICISSTHPRVRARTTYAHRNRARTHTHTCPDVTRGSLRPPLEIDRRFFLRSRVLLCFDSGGVSGFAQPSPVGFTVSRGRRPRREKLILSTLELALNSIAPYLPPS